MKKSLWAVVLMFAVAGSLYAAPKAPDWLNGSSSQYPNERFIVGVGLGDTLDGARSSARAEISKVFRSSVSQTMRDTHRENVTVGGGKDGTTGSVSADQATHVSTDGMIEGSEIAETWRDPKAGNYYALAVLNKSKVRQALAQQVMDAEETANNQLAASKSGGTVFDRIHALTAVLEALDRRDGLMARKRVVDPAAAGEIPAGISRAEVIARRRALTDSIIFAVQADDNDRDIKALVSARITGLGLRVADTLPPQAEGVVPVLIRPALMVVPAERNNPQWKFYNWNASFEIRETGENGRIIASAVQDGQAAHLTDDTARSKARTDAGQTLALGIEREINRNILGGK